MVAILTKSCSARVDCICANCVGKKQQLELNKYKRQNVQMAVPILLKQLNSKEFKSVLQLHEETNIYKQIIYQCLKFIEKADQRLEIQMENKGVDGRLVAVYRLRQN